MVIGTTYVELSESNMRDVRFVNSVHVRFLFLSFCEVQISKTVCGNAVGHGYPNLTNVQIRIFLSKIRSTTYIYILNHFIFATHRPPPLFRIFIIISTMSISRVLPGMQRHNFITSLLRLTYTLLSRLLGSPWCEQSQIPYYQIMY